MVKVDIKTRQRLFNTFVLLVALTLIALIIKFSHTFIQYLQKNSDNKINIVDLWNNGDYTRVLSLSEGVLIKNPINENALVFAGLASYNIAVYSSESEERYNYLENAIFYLRRRLSLDDKGKYLPEAYYTLAKAYNTKGPAYANLVIKYLEKAKKAGFETKVMDEYFGLAYIQLGKYDQGIDYFLKAEDNQRNSVFYFNLAEAYALAKHYTESERFYKRVISEGKDDNLRDKSRFQLALLYLKQSRYLDSQLILLDFLQKYPNNADAYFNLGETYYFLGDNVRARLAWQRAAQLDHSNSDVINRLHS